MLVGNEGAHPIYKKLHLAGRAVPVIQARASLTLGYVITPFWGFIEILRYTQNDFSNRFFASLRMTGLDPGSSPG